MPLTAKSALAFGHATNFLRVERRDL